MKAQMGVVIAPGSFMLQSEMGDTVRTHVLKSKFICVCFYHFLPSLLRASDQNPCQEYQQPADDDLEES